MPETLVKELSQDESLLFLTDNSRLVQSDSKQNFALTICDEVTDLRLCELIAFKRKVEQIDIVALLSDDEPDIEIIHLRQCEKFFFLDVRLVLELKELLAGAFAMLELNSIIHKSIIRRMI